MALAPTTIAVRDRCWYYKRATAMPFAVTVLSLIVAAPAMLHDTHRGDDSIYSIVAGVAGTFFIAGLYATVPYVVYLLLAMTLVRPHTARTYQVLALVAPAVIGAVCSIIIGILEVIDRGAGFGVNGFFLGATLVFGYFYVALVEGLRVVAEWRGWIMNTP